MPTVQVVGVGKESYTFIGQWDYLNRQHPNVTLVTMGPIALCRQTLGGDAIGMQFLRETHPMALLRYRYHTVVGSGRKERGP